MSLPSGVDLDVAGGTVHASQFWNRIDERATLRIGDVVDPHGNQTPHTNPNAMVQGAAWYRVDGIPVCLEGHLASCGDVLVASRFWYRVTG